MNFNTFQRVPETQKVFAKLNREDVIYAFECILDIFRISKAKKCYFKKNFNLKRKKFPLFLLSYCLFLFHFLVFTTKLLPEFTENIIEESCRIEKLNRNIGKF